MRDYEAFIAAVRFLNMHYSAEGDKNQLIKKINEFETKDIGVTEDTAASAADWVRLSIAAENDREMIRYAKQALKLEPENAKAKLQLISQYRNNEEKYLKELNRLQEEYRKKMEKAEAGSKAEKDWAAVTSELSRFYFHSARYRNAEALYEELLERDPEDSFDNAGTLMGLYALLDEENRLNEFITKNRTVKQYLKPLVQSVMYYMRQENAEARKLLLQAQEENNVLERAILMLALNLHENEGEVNSNDALIEDEEMINVLSELRKIIFLFETSESYPIWAQRQLGYRG
ncbi:MAG: hypothetical protein IKS32_10740 [Solobacterium sp.]|nr:hypothetical protein [Solobacterium sp.]